MNLPRTSAFHAPSGARAYRHPLASIAIFALATATEEAVDEATPETDESALADAPSQVFWEGPIGFENQLTGDGRLIENGALRWEVTEQEPVAIRYVTADVGAHDGAVVAGHVFGIERRDAGEIWAWGDFDLGGEHGPEAYRQVKEKLANGVSMDLDDVSFEVRVAKEIIDEQDAMMEALFDEDGEMPEIEREEKDGHVVVGKMSPDDEIMVMTDARVRSATIVAIPAFANARIALRDAPEDAPSVDTPIVASASPVAPPAAWFDNPRLSGPTPLEVTADGQVFGHLATWNVCHIASPAGEGICVTAPHSPTDYSLFHVGAVLTAEGSKLATGRITMNTGHAPLKASAMKALNHYDHTGAAIADVRVGEDAHGIWIAGAARPGATDEQLRVLRGSPLSGDWRPAGGGQLELVAALAVNTPGFPIPRPAGLVASGELQALVASGVVPSETDYRPTALLSDGDVERLRGIAERDRRREASSLASRARRSSNLLKIAAFAAKRKKA